MPLEEKLEHYIEALQALACKKHIKVSKNGLWRKWSYDHTTNFSVPVFNVWDDFKPDTTITYKVALFKIQDSGVYYTRTKAPYYYKETEQSPEFVRWISEEQTVEC